MSALYSLHNLSKRFGEREVLRIDSLQIEAGETYALLGANGAGKSTLMRILAFLDAPSQGELLYKGGKVMPGQLARFRPGVVWVPQFPVLFTGSLLYNVEYPLSLKQVPRRERREKALALLDMVKLGHLAKAPAHRLSGGESQRASIARALAAGAETILFDEPTANVDQRSLGDFIALVRDIRERQRLTIMITTHNPSLAATLCRRQLFLSEGRLVKKRLLAGGDAWPATLSKSAASDAIFSLRIPRAALDSVLDLSQETPEDIHNPHPAGAGSETPASRAILLGLARLAAGISLRVEVAPGRLLDLLLEDEISASTAQSLTLGATLAIESQEQ